MDHYSISDNFLLIPLLFINLSLYARCIDPSIDLCLVFLRYSQHDHNPNTEERHRQL